MFDGVIDFDYQGDSGKYSEHMNPTKHEREEKVKQFQENCEIGGFKKLAPNVYELKGPYSKTLTLCTLVHGNEVGGIEVFLKILKDIHLKNLLPKSNLRLILGNVDAYFEDKRFLETDLNRAFGLTEHKKKEEIRAREFECFLRDSDVLIDIHQTIGPTSTPFYIFEFEKKSYDLARYLHPDLPVVAITKKRSFAGKTSTAYTIGHGGMGITVETGQKAIEETQISLGLAIARKAIETDFNHLIPEFPITKTFMFHQIISNPDGTLEMVKKLSNFDPVKKDELLAENSTTKIQAESDGKILFPKYGEYARASAELAIVLKPVQTEDQI